MTRVPGPAESFTVEPAADTGGDYRAKLRPAGPERRPRGTERRRGLERRVRRRLVELHDGVGRDRARVPPPAWATGPRGAATSAIVKSDLSGGNGFVRPPDRVVELRRGPRHPIGRRLGGLRDDHEAGRALVVQGTGNVPGSARTFDGRARVRRRARDALGRPLAVPGDPLCSDWQWISPSAIREWMERWDDDCSWARGEKPRRRPAGSARARADAAARAAPVSRATPTATLEVSSTAEPRGRPDLCVLVARPAVGLARRARRRALG